MTQLLSTLASDFRLHDLFGGDQNFTATQVWVLEIERDGTSELRFIYGRVLPGTYRSNRWTGSTSSKTPLYELCSVKTHALTLHASSRQLTIFLEHFISGASLYTASQWADLAIDDKLNSKVGSVTFGANPIARPVMHLPTRGYFRFQTDRLSPTSYASVDSGAISADAKSRIFSVPESSDRLIAEAVCQALDADTGLDFSLIDAWRIGDFEFICAPGLTSSERAKFDVTLKGEQSSLKLFEPLTREPSELLVVATPYSDGCVQASYIGRIDKHATYPLDHQFVVDAFRNQTCTAYTLEIYAIGASGESFLQLKTGGYLVRSMNFNMQINESLRSGTSWEWLERRVAPKEKLKLAEAARIGRAIRPSRSVLGGHAADPWVTQNRLIENTVKQLHPKRSSGRFFLSLTDSDGTSRLELIDWLRNIFERHHDAQIAWIDPFMEDVGIELLNRMGTSAGSYFIVTTEKESNDDGKVGKDQPKRIERLLSKCADWASGYFGNVRLKVLAVPDKKIHDRMILIRSAQGSPLEGYHLSNSIQRANEKFPLLATPIPMDVMQKVFDYTDQIIQTTVHGDGNKAPSAKLIFDSTKAVENKDDESEKLNRRSSFVDAPRAGDVFSWWLDDSELAGLSGAELMRKLKEKGQLQDGQLDAECFDSLPKKFWNEGLPLEDFNSAWDALGYVLAHSHAGDLYTEDKQPLPNALKMALLEHLVPARANALPPRKQKSHLDLEHYRSQSLNTLLLSPDEPYHVFRYSPTDLAWSDYYAIKLLWSRAPNEMVNWLNSICSQPIKDERAHTLVIEALKIICLDISFDQHPDQIDALLKSKAGLLAWVGLHAFQNAISNGKWCIETLSKIDQLDPDSDQRTVLCWLINEANYVKSDIKKNLITKLTQSIDVPLKDDELQELLQPVRGRLGRLHHLTPWILESLLVPMLKQKTVDTAQVSRRWLNELTTQWRAALDKGNLYFTLEADGAFTDELAVLTVYLSPADQDAVFDELWKVFNLLARKIRQPLSAQLNWRTYIQAHEVNLWLYALARRIAALVHTEENQPLNELLQESESIIDRYPISSREIRSTSELLVFVKGDPDQIKSHSLHHTIKSAIEGLH